MRTVLMVAVALALSSCQDKAKTDKPVAAVPKGAGDCVKVSIAYGSEKKVWLEEQARAFDATRPTTAAGRCITLDLKAMGSGEVTQGILQGTLQPTVYSPASTAYLTLLNAAWVDKTGKPDALAPPGQTLVLSPVVIAMWKPMAEALGWPKKNLAWKDLLKVAQDTKGWAGLGHPEWGQFKLGHTQPEYSNSGLLAVLAVAYAGKGTTRGLTAADLDLPAVQAEIAAVERPIVHYGKSTGFFAEKLISRGPGYLSAAVLYESNVVEAYAKNPALPLVAIYPQEGTFWSDHPFSVLEAPWNGPEAREAANLLLKFLRAGPAQQRALALGFRPSDPSIALAAPLDEAHGVDPKQPQTLLEVPEAATLQKLIAVWAKNKKPTDVILVFDKSGSMNGKPMQEAQTGAIAFVDQLKDADQLTLLVFDDQVAPPAGPFKMATQRGEAKARIQALFASGGTSLYDATRAAYQLGLERAKTERDRIHAVVVMTDGQDESSKLPLEQLRSGLAAEDRAVRVFTIAYGNAADTKILDGIAEAGQGTSAKGTQANIVSVFQDIGAFF
jgi:Ca-activated chloride channel family protein